MSDWVSEWSDALWSGWALSGWRSDAAWAALALLAVPLTFALTRLMMRRRWLRILLRLGFWTGVAGLVTLAALFGSLYRFEAWLPIGAEISGDLAALRGAWVVLGALCGVVWALRRPVV